MKKKKVLFVLAFLLIAASVSYAIYRSRAGGTGTLGTATWSVVSSSADQTVDVVSGTTAAAYNLTVTNTSEVDVIYTIELTNLPTGIKAKLDGGNYVTESNNKITYVDAGTLLYGVTGQRTHVITFYNDLSATEISGRQIGIDVTFKQLLNPPTPTPTPWLPTYFAYGEPTTSSTTDYITLNKSVFVGLDTSGNKGVCIIKDGTLHCFQSNNVTYERDHLQQVFPDGICEVAQAYAECTEQDFYCIIFSEGSVNCSSGQSPYCEVDGDGTVFCY